MEVKIMKYDELTISEEIEMVMDVIWYMEDDGAELLARAVWDDDDVPLQELLVELRNVLKVPHKAI